MKDNRSVVRFRQQQTLHYLNVLPSKQEQATITREETENLLKKINCYSHTLFASVVLLLKHQAHLNMGFKNLNALLIKKTNLSKSFVSKLIKSANYYIYVDSELFWLSHVTEGAMRPFLDYDIDLQTAKQVWMLIVDESDVPRIIKSSHIRSAMKALGIKEKVRSPKQKIELNVQQKFSVNRYIRKISAIAPSIKTESEWRDYCTFIYKQLLLSHPQLQAKDEPANKQAA